LKFWKSLGLTRVILSRELSLDEIEEIRQQCPDIELEVFIHGALWHRLFRPLPAVRLLQPPRREPGHLHQLVPLDYKVDQCRRDRHRRYTKDRL